MIHESMQSLQLELAVQATDFVQQSVVALREPLMELRSQLIVLCTDSGAIPLHTGFMYSWRAVVDEYFQTFVTQAIEILEQWLIQGVLFGAAMVGEVLLSQHKDVMYPPVTDLFDMDEIVHFPAYDKLMRLHDALRRDIYQCFYAAVLVGQTAFDVLQALLSLIPCTDVSGHGRYTWRLASIARTEVGRAISEGTHAVLEVVAGYVSHVTKTWMHPSSLAGGRTGHIEAEGQTVAAHELFVVAPVVGGTYERLRFPRDMAASPSNITNCGCFMVPMIGV